MLLRTYDRIIDLFQENQGYMKFELLKENGITVLQIRELVQNGTLECFSRGWYWCNSCGIEKSKESKYIEIGKVNPNAVICMESACYLQGLLEKEPQVVTVATERTDRRKMEFAFPVRRFYFQNTEQTGEILERKTKFGSYKIYSLQRTMCDCIRCKDEIQEDFWMEIESNYRNNKLQAKRLMDYASKLRARKNIQDFLDGDN